MTTAMENTGGVNSTDNSQPDLQDEVDLQKNPAFKKIPGEFKQKFPGLFDQSLVNKHQQPTADKLRKLPWQAGPQSMETLNAGTEDSINKRG